jgi:glutathione S-transferase
MNELILHHYPGSPFSEKVRLVLGYKGLTWKSVTVPVMLPKPDVVALTGGYRRTPFMQIGADVYCDSALMCRVIDRLAPDPPLHPPASAGSAEIVGQWADTALFWTAVPYTMQPAGAAHIFEGASPEYVKAFRDDRAAMTQGMRRPTLADLGAQLRVQLGRLERLLGDGRGFLVGDVPTIADFSAVQSVWFIRRAPPVAVLLESYPRLLSWYERVHAFGHGTAEPMTSAESLEIARSAATHATTRVAEGEAHAAGDAVTVTPTDYACDPVAGRLVGLDAEEVVIARADPRAGDVQVHFPRIGYQVKAQS